MPMVIMMAGTGSDDDYLRRSFGPAVTSAGDELVALPPSADLIDDYRRTLDEAAAQASAAGRRFLVGGVSLGAVVALRWALDRPRAGCAGVLAALPPWSGPAHRSVAAGSALITADSIESDGLEATIETMSPASAHVAA